MMVVVAVAGVAADGVVEMAVARVPVVGVAGVAGHAASALLARGNGAPNNTVAASAAVLAVGVDAEAEAEAEAEADVATVGNNGSKTCCSC